MSSQIAEDLQPTCPFPIIASLCGIVHVEAEKKISFWNSYLTESRNVSSSYSSYNSKHEFMWFHRDHNNGKLTVVDRNDLTSYHFSQELVCKFSLKENIYLIHSV